MNTVTNEEKIMSKKQFFAITVMLSILSGIFAMTLFACGFHDNDYLWHIRLGEYFLENKEIFSQDVFSWVGPELNLKETAHSWAFEILIAVLHKITGDLFTTGSVFCFVSAFVFSLVVSKLFYKEHSIFTFVFSLIIGILFCNPRPQLMGNLLFVLSIYILTKSFSQKSSKFVLFLPLISFLWAQIHGGTLPILFAFEGLFIVLGLFPSINIGPFRLNRYFYVKEYKTPFFKTIQKKYKKEFLKYPLKMFGILLLSMATGLLNPYGFGLYYYFFFTNNQATKQFVSEWQPALLGDWSVILLILLLFVPLISFKKKISFEKWILPAICLVLGAVYQRILIYGIFASLPLFADICDRFSFVKKGKPYSFRDAAVFVTGFTVIMLCIFVPSNKDVLTIPDKITHYLKTSENKRLYNAYNDGAELIYNGIPVFIDSRADLYPGDLIKGAVYFNNADFQEVGDMSLFLEQYDFDIILLKKDCAATIEYLDYSKQWNRVLNHGGYIIFEKANQKEGENKR